MSSDNFKKAAAQAAMDYVEPGMRLGLGTGSTAAHFVDLVGSRVRAGMALQCVPTSEATRVQAETLGIQLATLDELPELDLTVDGADEIGPNLALIKGGGAALLREKIVACASQRMIVIADASKCVDTLGAFPLPVEIVRFGGRATMLAMARAAGRLGLKGELKQRVTADGMPLVTDNGNFIIDCHFNMIGDPAALAHALSGIAGIVEHGLFVGIADLALVAGKNGVETFTR